MPVELTEEMAAAVNTAYPDTPCLIATASAEGDPDLSFRGSLIVYDTDHLAYWERALGESLDNLRQNPKIAALYRNAETRQGWRFYGVASLHETEGDPVRDRIMDLVRQLVPIELERDPELKGCGVLIRVDRVRQGTNVIMQREA